MFQAESRTECPFCAREPFVGVHTNTCSRFQVTTNRATRGQLKQTQRLIEEQAVTERVQDAITEAADGKTVAQIRASAVQAVSGKRAKSKLARGASGRTRFVENTLRRSKTHSYDVFLKVWTRGKV